MEKKKIALSLTLAILFLFSLAPIHSTLAETHRVLSFTHEGLRVRVYAPYQAYAGSRITIEVNVDAIEDLEDVTVDLYIFGSQSDDGKVGYDSWDEDYNILYTTDLDEGEDYDEDIRFNIPDDSDPGLVYGHVTAEWTTWSDGEDHTYAESFTITYLLNEDYEDLLVEYEDLLDEYAGFEAQLTVLENEITDLLINITEWETKYNTLNITYQQLKSNYDSLVTDYNTLSTNYNALKTERDMLNTNYNTLLSDYETLESQLNQVESDYNILVADHTSLLAERDTLELKFTTSSSELETYRYLTYILGASTAIFITTTIILLMRKPKTTIKDT